MARKAVAKRRERRASVRVARLPTTMPAASGPITVRHYCQGIGDCHLLRFPRADGGDFWMLIDCGLHSSVKGGPGTIARIVADIAERTGRIDVVVVTHEHWDHVSGFLTETEAFGRLSVGEVWMGWTENPADRQAQELDTFKSQALAALRPPGSCPPASVDWSKLGQLGVRPPGPGFRHRTRRRSSRGGRSAPRPGC